MDFGKIDYNNLLFGLCSIIAGFYSVVNFSSMYEPELNLWMGSLFIVIGFWLAWRAIKPAIKKNK